MGDSQSFSSRQTFPSTPAGVGRTGCFAVIQRMLADYSTIGEIPDENRVTELFQWIRSRRMKSVDNVDQFLWLHQIADSLKEGELELRPIEKNVYGSLIRGGKF